MPEAGIELQGAVIDGKYRLGRYLGSSERSAVFLTERKQEIPQAAAIKLIPASPASAEAELARLRLISKLSHPNLLQIFEVGRCQHEGAELLYVVMEYAEENLEQILGQRPLSEQETDEMLKPTLEALAFLHKHGFVHGHIQPANILVAGERLKLSSDGICKVGEKSGRDTGMYAPPEELETPAAPSKDIWSLGVTVVQALTQLLPVRDGENEPATLPETLPARFADLAHNCLELIPQRRCTLAEIAENLHYKLEVRQEMPVQHETPVKQEAPPVRQESPVQQEVPVKQEMPVAAPPTASPRLAPASPKRSVSARQPNRVPAPAPRNYEDSGSAARTAGIAGAAGSACEAGNVCRCSSYGVPAASAGFPQAVSVRTATKPCAGPGAPKL